MTEFPLTIHCYKQPYQTTGIPVQIPGFEKYSFAAYHPPLKSGNEMPGLFLIAETTTGLPVARKPLDTIESALDAAMFELIRQGHAALETAILLKKNNI